jgi:aminopeptidase N
VLVLDDARRFFTFVDVDQPPVLSLLRGFSAPVILIDGLSDADLLVLLGHDSDSFNRWEAGQRLAMNRLLASVRAGDAPATLDGEFVAGMRAILRDPALDPAFKELVLTPPSEPYIAEQLTSVDPQRIHRAREAMKSGLAHALRADWEWAFETHQVKGGYSPDPVSAGRRGLANLALAMLCRAAVEGSDAVWPGRAYQRFKDATNMTDRQGALAALLFAGSPLAAEALERFIAMFQGDALVVDKWFSLQATAPERGGRVFERVKALLQHRDFSLANPNRARSLIGAFVLGNPAGFHRADAAGYAFWAERVLELDRINPQLASRIARALDRWSQLAEPYRSAARAAIARVAAAPGLSSDTNEIVTRALAIA